MKRTVLRTVHRKIANCEPQKINLLKIRAKRTAYMLLHKIRTRPSCRLLGRMAGERRRFRCAVDWNEIANEISYILSIYEPNMNRKKNPSIWNRIDDVSYWAEPSTTMPEWSVRCVAGTLRWLTSSATTTPTTFLLQCHLAICKLVAAAIVYKWEIRTHTHTRKRGDGEVVFII